MSGVISSMRGFAERLIAHETSDHSAGENGENAPQAFIAIEKMRPHLATLMGNAGFHGLISRALALAGAKSGWLRAIHVNANGSLQRPDGIALQAGQSEIAEGEIVLLSQLLGLLVAFIGENLTIRLLREVWPKLPADDPGPGNGGNNEKAK